MARRADLAGLRVLVVEDEMLVSLFIEDVLLEQSCVIVGPFDRIDAAMDAATSGALDLALLDVNVAGRTIYPVAEALARRDIPFLLLSGYGDAAVPVEHPDWRACAKPFRPEELIAMLIDQLPP